MSNQYVLKILTFLCVIFFNIPLQANTTARINAVSDFLLERANSNYLYIFENRIKSEKLSCYLPNISKQLEEIDLRLLLKTQSYWESSVKTDLEGLILRLIQKSIKDLKTNRKTLGLPINISKETKFFSMDLKHIKDDGIKAILLDINASLKVINQEFTESKNCDLPSINNDTVKIVIVELKKIQDNYTKLIDIMKEKPLIALSMDSNDKKISFNKRFTDIEGYLGFIISSYNAYLNVKSELDSAKDQTSKAIIILKHMKNYKLIKNNKKYAYLKRYVLFFAEIQDAKNDEESIKSILTAYTLPPVSFAMKRDPYNNYLFINSYLGTSWGTNSSKNKLNETKGFNLYAPVGLEFAGVWEKLCSSPVSIYLAPFDFAYPISLKLRGIESELNLDDIVSPSIGITKGIKNLPLSFGIAIQKGKEVGSGNEEVRVFGFVAFDMPLLSLY